MFLAASKASFSSSLELDEEELEELLEELDEEDATLAPRAISLSRGLRRMRGTKNNPAGEWDAGRA